MEGVDYKFSTPTITLLRNDTPVAEDDSMNRGMEKDFMTCCLSRSPASVRSARWVFIVFLPYAREPDLFVEVSPPLASFLLQRRRFLASER